MNCLSQPEKGIEEAVNILLDESNTLFDDLNKNVENNAPPSGAHVKSKEKRSNRPPRCFLCFNYFSKLAADSFIVAPLFNCSINRGIILNKSPTRP